jgi:hypothetical protein
MNRSSKPWPNPRCRSSRFWNLLVLSVAVVSPLTGLGGEMLNRSSVEVTISVIQEGQQLVAYLRFANKGTAPALVMKGNNGLGVGKDAMPTTLLDPEFAIACDGKRVRYIGPIAYWKRPGPNDFTELAPGEVVENRAIRIDDIYRFEAGAHGCYLDHRHLQFDLERNRAFAVVSEPQAFTYDLKKD